MPINAALIMGGASLLGSLFSGSSTANASSSQAADQLAAAKLAIEEARFRPVGVSGSRYGTTSSQIDPATGRVTGMSYALTPEMQAYQNRFQTLAGQGLTDAEQARGMFNPLRQAGQQLYGMGQSYLNQPQDQRIGNMASGYLQPSQYAADIGKFGSDVFNRPEDQRFAQLGAGYLQPSKGSQALTQLGQSYVGQNPQDVEQQYMKRQMALLAPGREQEGANLQNQLFQQGRGGLRVETGTGGGATTPELQAMYNARAQQDAALAANAQQAGQQSAAFGANLLGQGQQLGMAGQQFGLGAIQAGQGLNQQRQQFGLGAMQAGQQLGMAGQQFGMGAIQAGQGLNQQRQQFGLGAMQAGQQYGMAGQGFGADLLQRQQALEQQRMQFGTGLFSAGSGLFGQYNANVTGALQPYSNYAAQAYGLEQQGMGPLETSAALGGRVMQGGAYAGRYGLEGATAAGTAQQKAGAYSPFGTALSGLGTSPEFTSGLRNQYENYLRNERYKTDTPAYFDYGLRSAQ